MNAYDALGHNHAVFYRGIKIYDSLKPTLYRYNLLDKVTLTEDRTLKYSFYLSEAVEKSIITSNDENYIVMALTAGELFYEGSLSFTESYSEIPISDEFKAMCRTLNERPRNLNMAAIRWYQQRTQSLQPLTLANLSNVQKMQLDKAVKFVKKTRLHG